MARISQVATPDGLASAFGSTLRVSRKRKSPDVPFEMLDVGDDSFSNNIDYAVSPEGVCLPMAPTQPQEPHPPMQLTTVPPTPTMHVTPALRDALTATHPLLHSPNVPLPAETQALVVYNPQPWQRTATVSEVPEDEDDTDTSSAMSLD
jgi:hypothetical protein